MKISYLFIISLLYAPLTVTDASAAFEKKSGCEKGAELDPLAEHDCIWKEKVKNPCPQGYYFRNRSSDCAKCEDGYKYNRAAGKCENSR